MIVVAWLLTLSGDSRTSKANVSITWERSSSSGKSNARSNNGMSWKKIDQGHYQKERRSKRVKIPLGVLKRSSVLACSEVGKIVQQDRACRKSYFLKATW